MKVEMSKPFKGELTHWFIDKFPQRSDWRGCPLHDGKVWMAYGYRKGDILMHTSPIVKWENLEDRIVIETENSIYHLIGSSRSGEWRL